MIPSRNLHTSPSLSTVHLLLRKEVINAGFDVELLRDLLWLVNAPDSLVAFPLISQNLIEILSASTRQWQIPMSDFHFHNDTLKLLEWVANEDPRLSSILGPLFERKPRAPKGQDEKPDNPVVGNGATLYPTYAALCNSQASDLLKEKFRLLQGQLLYAQVNELYSRQNRDEYENYVVQASWKGLPNSPSVACLAVRELSEHRFAEVLLSLSVEQTPQLFAKSLDNLPTVDDSDFQKHLKGLRSFLQKAAGLRDWVHRQSNGGNAGGGGTRIHGHVEISKQTFQDTVDVGDLDDPDSNWGDIVQITSIFPSFENQRDLLSSDLFPDEMDTEDLFLTGDDNLKGFSGGIYANSAAQVRHVLMSNQMFPWSYQHLSISEVFEALSTCATWVNDHFINNKSPQHEDADIKKLEAICMMRIMLFTGSKIERARELMILPRGKEGESGELALITNASGLQEWRIQAIRPNYRTSLSVQDGSDRGKTDYFRCLV